MTELNSAPTMRVRQWLWIAAAFALSCGGTWLLVSRVGDVQVAIAILAVIGVIFGGPIAIAVVSAALLAGLSIFVALFGGGEGPGLVGGGESLLKVSRWYYPRLTKLCGLTGWAIASGIGVAAAMWLAGN